MSLTAFRNALRSPTIMADLRVGLIGRNLPFDTPAGRKRLLYADYTASGRALRQVEEFVAEQVLPYYANTHTEASFCGEVMSRMRQSARDEVARLTGAGTDCHVIFTGSGATSAVNRLVGLLDIAGTVRAGGRVTVLTGPYEHHSNILPWRESGAAVIEIPEAPEGGPDRDALARALEEARGADLLVGTFAAASNVSGIITDAEAITRQLKAAGALAFWDYAAAAPYLPIDMGQGDAAKDAVVFSPHKFAGGPGASGILILRDSIARRTCPTAPGGGTVSFVSPWRHDYSTSIEAREEGGTPNVIGDIRVALAMLVKEAVGTDAIAARDAQLRHRALERWSAVPEIELLGQRPGAEALPIFSFRVRKAGGGHIHHQLFTRMLSDQHGVQARGGCACAGPYAHRLLDLDRDRSEDIFRRLAAGQELERPGWVRLNLSYLHSDAEADSIIDAVIDLARRAPQLAEQYRGDIASARFRAVALTPVKH